MKKLKLPPLFFAILFSLLACAPASAQQDDVSPPENADQTTSRNNRPRLLEALNLSPEQIRQIRLINRTRRPQVQLAQRRWRDAQVDLDQAIYADNPNEEEIKLRLRVAQTAHAEFIKARSEIEYQIRKVLTPEQLQKFRQLRERARQMLGNPNGAPPRRPLNRFQRRRPNNSPLD